MDIRAVDVAISLIETSIRIHPTTTHLRAERFAAASSDSRVQCWINAVCKAPVSCAAREW
jgi:hypothetical protein